MWAAWMFGDRIEVTTYLGIVVVAIGVWLAGKHGAARARRANMGRPAVDALVARAVPV